MKNIFRTSVLSLSLLLGLTSCNNISTRTFSGVKENKVGELTLYAFNGDSERVPGTVNLGHSYVTIKNTSSASFDVGYYQLQANSSVSIGSWSQNAHFGLWYNVEKIYMEMDRYQGRISITTDINLDDVTYLTNFIKNNDTWSFSKNCSYYSLSMFNLVANQEDKISVSGTVTPGKLFSYIKTFDSPRMEFDKNMEDLSNDKCYYYDGKSLVEMELVK